MAEYDATLEKFTKDQLRENCRELHLHLSGNKADLISRLVEAELGGSKLSVRDAVASPRALRSKSPARSVSRSQSAGRSVSRGRPASTTPKTPRSASRSRSRTRATPKSTPASATKKTATPASTKTTPSRKSLSSAMDTAAAKKSPAKAAPAAAAAPAALQADEPKRIDIWSVMALVFLYLAFHVGVYVNKEYLKAQ